VWGIPKETSRWGSGPVGLSERKEVRVWALGLRRDDNHYDTYIQYVVVGLDYWRNIDF